MMSPGEDLLGFEDQQETRKGGTNVVDLMQQTFVDVAADNDGRKMRMIEKENEHLRNTKE